MKKGKKFIIGNIKTVVAFALGIIVSGITVYAITSSSVVYDNSQSGLSSTNVKDALDELYQKVNTWIDPSYIDFNTLKAVRTKWEEKIMFASTKALCYEVCGKLRCIKRDNYAVEKEKVKQMFSCYPSGNGNEDGHYSCTETETRVECIVGRTYFYNEKCYLTNNGDVYCQEHHGSPTGECKVTTSDLYGTTVNCQ